MNIDDGDDPKVRRKSLKMEMWDNSPLNGDARWKFPSSKRPRSPHGRPARKDHQPPSERSRDLEIGSLGSVSPWVDTGSETSGQRLCGIMRPMKATVAVIAQHGGG